MPNTINIMGGLGNQLFQIFTLLSYPLEPYGTNMCYKHLTNLTIKIVYS